jgi:ATP-dependent helicase/DNAse subunit B
VRLISGPEGSGKTNHILDQFREALRAHEPGVRLLVPTATLAQHLQNRLAREGLVFRRGQVQTLSGFVRELTPDVNEVADAVLYLLVEGAAKRVARPEFAGVVELPGFCASLKRVIGEFAAAGCTSERLAIMLPDAPLAEAFLAVYREVDRELARRGLVTRAARLHRAMERFPQSGVRRVWMDGFHVLTDPELNAIEVMSHHAEFTLAMGDGDLTDTMRTRLAGMGFQELRAGGARATAVRALVKAPSLEREVEEIARRIVEQAAAGRPFREMGIIVRAADVYVAILQTTLERFGIPARFYFDADLERHPAVRFLAGAVDAMLAGWDHAKTLAVLRLAPQFARKGSMDWLDFKVREQIPGAGLESLKALTIDEPITQFLDDMARLDAWRILELPPQDWAKRFHELRKLFRPSRPLDAASHELAIEWRSQSRALDAFDAAFEEAADEASQAMDAVGAISLDTYWRVVKSLLRVKPLRPADGRRNVVHVLSAHEARQWVLPVVFVCGMVEKQFPRMQQQDPFFPDAARSRLHAAGVRVRTSTEFDREERALFESAITRATLLTTLSYPEFDGRGERNLPSLYLEDLLVAAEPARPVRPAPKRIARDRGPVEVRDPALLAWLKGNTPTFSPSGLEQFLQCPFQYFASKTLRLRTAPDPPQKRLNPLFMGNIAHQVLEEWWGSRGDIAEVFERVYAQILREKHIPPGYHTERVRNDILDDLLRFTREDSWPRAQFTSEVEKKFELALAEGIQINGRIDRVDTGPDGNAYVIDYKYSRAANVKGKLTNETLLQAPLYLIAAQEVFGAKPVGVFYVGLRGGLEYAGWGETTLMDALAFPENWLTVTRERVLQIVEAIRSGKVDVAPADPDKCRWCDVRDVCRVEGIAALVQMEEGA